MSSQHKPWARGFSSSSFETFDILSWVRPSVGQLIFAYRIQPFFFAPTAAKKYMQDGAKVPHVYG